MSDSASAALAAASAAAATSAGTRWNARPDASHTQASSSSKGFSPSCTECRLKGWWRGGGGVVGAAWAGHGGAGRAGVARSQRRPACALSPLHCAHPSHPSPSTPPPLFHAHFGDLHHALGACQLAELEALDLGLGGLPALAHGGAVVFLRDGWVWERVWTGAGRQQQRRASTPRARLGLVARASHTHFHPPTPPLSTPLPPPIQHVRERRPTGRPRRERGPRHRIRRRHRTRRPAGWTQRGGRTSKD